MKIDEQTRCLITGATSGLGYELALSLLRSGAEVVIHGRTAASVGAAAERLRAAVADAKLSTVHGDLSDLDSVGKLLGQLPEERIDLLVNNAGAAFPDFACNAKGIERTVWINHFVPLMLTQALLPRMNDNGVVATISSTVAGFVSLDADAPDVTGAALESEYAQLRAYSISKLLGLCAMNALGRRLGGRPAVIAIDPGGIQTDFARKAGDKAFLDMTLQHWEDCHTAEESARQVLEAVGGDDLQPGGRYYEGKLAVMPESAQDPNLADTVLARTEEVIAGF